MTLIENNDGKGWMFNGLWYRPSDPREPTRLPAGLYEIHQTRDEGMIAKPKPKMATDRLIAFDLGAGAACFAEVDRFLLRRPYYKAHHLLHKRGALFYGPPGTGKTAIAMMLAAKLIQEHDAIVIVDPNSIGSVLSFMECLRRLEPNRLIVVYIEDIDQFVEHHSLHVVTQLLDGHSQVDNVLYLATTNHMDKVPPEIRARPSRFDLLLRVGSPKLALRRAYLAATFKLDGDVLEAYAKASKGLSFAHLKEMVVLGEALGLSLAEAEKRVRKMDSMHKHVHDGEDDADDWMEAAPVKNLANNLAAALDALASGDDVADAPAPGQANAAD